jgi:hypothetical protein
MFGAPLIEADAFFKKTEFTMALKYTGPKKSKLMPSAILYLIRKTHKCTCSLLYLSVMFPGQVGAVNWMVRSHGKASERHGARSNWWREDTAED